MNSFLCGCCTKGGCRGDQIDDETQGIYKEHGKPLKYDPHFKGPINSKARRPKDLLCLTLFVAFIIGLLAIGMYAWVMGQPQRLVYPTDSQGRLCGVHEAVADRPFLLFFDLVKCAQVVSVTEVLSGDFDTSAIFTCPTPQVCVSECPTMNEFGVRSNPVCVDSVDTTPFINISNIDFADAASSAGNVATLLELIRTDQCAPYYITSTAVARRCIPTFVDLGDQAADILFNSSTDLQTLANMTSDFSITDVFLNVSVQSIVEGQLTENILNAVREFVVSVYQDFIVVWPGLLIGLAIIFSLSFLYIVLLRCFAGPLVFLAIVLSLLLIIAITVFCYYQFYCFQDTANLFDQFNAATNETILDFLNTTQVQAVADLICAETDVLREFINTQLPWFGYQEYTWLALGIAGSVVLLVLIILLIVLAKKILVSIQIIKEASKAVGGVPSSVFYPIVTVTLLAFVLGYWVMVAVFLVTATEPTYAVIMNGSVVGEPDGVNISEYGLTLVTNGTACDPAVFTATVFRDDPNSGYNTTISCQFKEFFTSNFLLALQFYHVFGLFWLTNFVLALGEVTLAGGFASWYWTFDKKKGAPRFALIRSFGRAVLFHSGSIAFGALLIAIIQMLRVLLAYVQKKLKGKAGKVAQTLLCLLGACLWCFEKILRYVNRQAYIEIAIYGYDFCTGACTAVKLLLRNILTTAVKDGIVAFLLLFGKILITSIVGILAYLGFADYLGGSNILWQQPLNYYLVPIIVLTVTAFLVASGFMTVYHMAVDTVFICALEDLERNDGKDKPYFMSKKLMKLLNVKNKKNDQTTMQMESLETVQS